MTQTPSLSLIFARSENFCIGQDGKIPWRLPDDFQHFKQTTMGKPIVMGRSTYEDHESALPGRLNVVITSQENYEAAQGVVVVDSLDAAIDAAGKESNEVFIIGGADLFATTVNRADHVYETVVHTAIEGDTFLSEMEFDTWDTEVLQEHPADDQHAYAFTIYKHTRMA